MSDTPPADLATAHLARSWAREAGDLTLEYFRSTELVVDSKDDGTPVTRADREAETLLRERITKTFEEDTVRGEEHADRVGSSGRTWVLDPIDGTKAFSRGVGTYSNLVYLEDEHGPAIGVINLPALGETVWAARGHGCFVDDRPVQAPPGGRGDDSLDGRVLGVSDFSDWDGARFERAQGCGVAMRTWGDAYGYALVATGRIDAMFDPAMEWWDLAAPMVVIREAGATITRRDGGEDLTLRGRDGAYGLTAIASSGGSHDLWVDLLS